MCSMESHYELMCPTADRCLRRFHDEQHARDEHCCDLSRESCSRITVSTAFQHAYASFRPRVELSCCWNVKQPTNKQTSCRLSLLHLVSTNTSFAIHSRSIIMAAKDGIMADSLHPGTRQFVLFSFMAMWPEVI